MKNENVEYSTELLITAQLGEKGGGVLGSISGRGVPPTVSKCNRWLDQFL